MIFLALSNFFLAQRNFYNQFLKMTGYLPQFIRGKNSIIYKNLDFSYVIVKLRNELKTDCIVTVIFFCSHSLFVFKAYN